jgi:hypothetical protein
MTETESEPTDVELTVGQASDRLPRNLREKLLANLRPQPAIPAVFVFFLAVLLPVMSQASQPPDTGTSTWLIFLVAAGILGSCGLAIAAGFCSLFPQIAWFVLAGWCFRFAGTGALPVYNQVVLSIGIVAVVCMFVVQLWRVRTGKFVATLRADEPDSEGVG